jgi:sugar O-acyltransferase (sialic acid O-acetyltransferase NeuD family)
MTTPVIILGIGGYSATLAEMMQGTPWHAIGFLDDADARQGTTVYGLPVLGRLADAARFPEARFVNAIGSAHSGPMKPAIIGRTGLPPERFVTLVHPSAQVSPSATLGHGTVVCQGCVVMAGARLGVHVKTLPLATVSYGSTIGDYATIAGGAVIAAEVRVGTGAYVGANAAVRERLAIGDYAVIGMLAAVTRDVAARTTVVGNPARPLQRTKERS